MTVYVCDYCLTEYRFPISAALCCDIVSNELSDEDVPGVALGYD